MRDPDLVLRDVVNGLVTPEWAGKIYGVVVIANPWRVDRAATQKQRDAVYAWRKRMATDDEGRTTKVKRETSNVKRKSDGGRRTADNKKRVTSGVKRQTSKVKLASKKKTVARAKTQKTKTRARAK